jgi:hypothetical protein
MCVSGRGPGITTASRAVAFARSRSNSVIIYAAPLLNDPGNGRGVGAQIALIHVKHDGSGVVAL